MPTITQTFGSKTEDKKRGQCEYWEPIEDAPFVKRCTRKSVSNVQGEVCEVHLVRLLK